MLMHLIQNGSQNQVTVMEIIATVSPLIRRLFVTCDVFARYCFVVFSMALICMDKQYLGVFAFSWLFCGPHFGQILCVLPLDKSSDLKPARTF